MKTISKVFIFSIFTIIMFLTGCATNRSVVSLKMPDITTPAQQKGSKVFIKSVSDLRVFQENPKTQDIPSMGFGGAGISTDDLKKRAIGRKRNTYGKALGDILLNENQTVESVTENAIKQSFSAAGYAIVDQQKDIDDNTILIDAKITKFWAYMTPGFWAITLTSDISTDLELTKKRDAGSKVETITVKAEGKYQVATENNWMKIVDQAVSQYIEKLKELIENQIGF